MTNKTDLSRSQLSTPSGNVTILEDNNAGMFQFATTLLCAAIERGAIGIEAREGERVSETKDWVGNMEVGVGRVTGDEQIKQSRKWLQTVRGIESEKERRASARDNNCHRRTTRKPTGALTDF